MSKPIIAVDIDDVLSLTARGFTEFSNQTWGTKLTPEDFDEDFLSMWQVDYEVAVDRLQQFLQSDLAAHYDHDEAAESVLTELTQSFTIAAVTSRSQSLQNATRDWLDERYPGIFEALYFSGIYDNDKSREAHVLTKETVYRKLKPQYVIDDHLKHCRAAAQLGIKTILFGNYRWNQAQTLPSGIVRCTDWPAVKAYFDSPSKAAARDSSIY